MSAQSKTGKPTALSVLTRFNDEHCHYFCILCLKVLTFSSSGGLHTSNAWSHMRNNHSDELKLLIQALPARMVMGNGPSSFELHLENDGGMCFFELSGTKLSGYRSEDIAEKKHHAASKGKITGYTMAHNVIVSMKQDGFRDVVKKALLRFLSANGLPFNLVESRPFQAFCETIYSPYGSLRLNSRSVVVRGLKELADSETRTIQTLLRSSVSVALSSDEWSSMRSYLPLMSVGGYFLRGGLLEYRVLAVCHPEQGKSEHLAEQIDSVLRVYDISNKISSLTTDGEPKMKAIIDHTSHVDRHATCLAHSLILAVKHVMMKDGDNHTPISGVVGRVERIIRFFHDSKTATHKLLQMQVATDAELAELLERELPDGEQAVDWVEGNAGAAVEGQEFEEEAFLETFEEYEDGKEEEEEEEEDGDKGGGVSGEVVNVDVDEDADVLEGGGDVDDDVEAGPSSPPPEQPKRRKRALRLLRPCPTRWTSRLRAIIRFLTLWRFVRVLVCAENKRRTGTKKELPSLSPSEILFLQMIVTVLAPFYGLIIHVQTMAPRAVTMMRMLKKLRTVYADRILSRGTSIGDAFKRLLKGDVRGFCTVAEQVELMETVRGAVADSNKRMTLYDVQQKYHLPQHGDVDVAAGRALKQQLSIHILGSGFSTTPGQGINLDTILKAEGSFQTIELASVFLIVRNKSGVPANVDVNSVLALKKYFREKTSKRLSADAAAKAERLRSLAAELDSNTGKRGRSGEDGSNTMEPPRKKGPAVLTELDDTDDDDDDDDGAGAVLSRRAPHSVIQTGSHHATPARDAETARENELQKAIARKTKAFEKALAFFVATNNSQHCLRNAVRLVIDAIRLEVAKWGLSRDALGVLGFDPYLFFWAAIANGRNPATLVVGHEETMDFFNFDVLQDLAPTAVELLMTPMCSAADERLFSQASMSFNRQRLNLKSENAARQLFIRANVRLADKDDVLVGARYNAESKEWEGGITRKAFRERCRKLRTRFLPTA